MKLFTAGLVILKDSSDEYLLKSFKANARVVLEEAACK